jgi:Na+-driven multidrug efflux pump
LTRQLVTLATPVALQNLIGASLAMVDTIMIGNAGAATISGVALANQLVFLLNILLFGIGSATVVLTAQYWGKRDIPAIRRSLGLSMVIMIAAATMFFAIAQLAPRAAINLFSPDPTVIDVGARFLRLVSWSFLCQAVSTAFVNVLRSIELVRMPLIAGAVSLAVNTVLNWCLILATWAFQRWALRAPLWPPLSPEPWNWSSC